MGKSSNATNAKRKCSEPEAGAGKRRKDNHGDEAEHSQAPEKLKCPYYQRRPRQHQRTSCRLIAYDSMRGVKFHIERVHTRPSECGCCREGDVCEKTLSKLRTLNLNRVPFARASPAEKWRLLFKELFGHAERVPSPYEHISMTFEEETIFSSLLEKHLMQEFGSLAPGSGERISAILSKCRTEALALAVEGSRRRSSTFPASASAEETFGEQAPASSSRKMSEVLQVTSSNHLTSEAIERAQPCLNCHHTMDVEMEDPSTGRHVTEPTVARDTHLNDSWMSDSPSMDFGFEGDPVSYPTMEFENGMHPDLFGTIDFDHVIDQFFTQDLSPTIPRSIYVPITSHGNDGTIQTILPQVSQTPPLLPAALAQQAENPAGPIATLLGLRCNID